MARSIGMSFDKPETLYRSVVLYLYSGTAHNFPLKTYTTADGTVHSYHSADAYGPYSTRAPATGQITSAIRNHEQFIKQGYYSRSTRPVAQVTGFVEEQIPAWSAIAATVRTV